MLTWSRNRGTSCSSIILVKDEWVNNFIGSSHTLSDYVAVIEFGHYKTRIVAEEATVIDYYM